MRPSELFELQYEIVKSILSADEQRRIDFFRRDDGVFQFVELKHYQRDQDDVWSPPEYWAPLPGAASVYETLDIAEREARSQISWLRKEAG